MALPFCERQIWQHLNMLHLSFSSSLLRSVLYDAKSSPDGGVTAWLESYRAVV